VDKVKHDFKQLFYVWFYLPGEWARLKIPCGHCDKITWSESSQSDIEDGSVHYPLLINVQCIMQVKTFLKGFQWR